MLLIGLPFSQLSRVSSVSVETAIVGGVYVESVGEMRICALGPLDVWAMDASGATELPDVQAASASAAETPTIVPVIDFVVVMLFMVFLLLEKIYSITGQDVNVLTQLFYLLFRKLELYEIIAFARVTCVNCYSLQTFIICFPYFSQFGSV